MGIKGLVLVSALWIAPLWYAKFNSVNVENIWEERICTISEETIKSVRLLTTECEWTSALYLEWSIPGEECYITPEFNRRCNNPDFNQED